MLTLQTSAALLLLAKHHASARRDNNAVHKAADAHYKAMLLAVQYAFLRGRKAYKSGGIDAAVKAIRTGLLVSLPPVLGKVLEAGGKATIAGLPKNRAAEFDEAQHPRDDKGRFGNSDIHVYHITSKSAPLASFKEKGILPSTHSIYGNGVYMANTPESTQYYESLDKGQLLRIDKEKLVEKFGVYPQSKTGVEYDEHTGEVTLSGNRAIPPDMVDVKTSAGWQKLSEWKAPAAPTAKLSRAGFPMKRQTSFKPQRPTGLKWPTRHASLRTLAPIAIRFDVADPNAVKWAKEHAAELADGISETSRERIKDAVARAVAGAGIDEAYDDILDAVGSEARADVIARTETMTAANEGQREAWDQAVEKGLLSEDSKAVWIATSGCCDDCDDLDGETRDLDGEYPDPGADGPPLHPNCRCTEGIAG